MRTRTVTVHEGEDVGPVDWDHPTAKDKPEFWREAALHPRRFLFDGREILRICMYDGWPYWKPTPAIFFVGPLKCGEWAHFDSYGVRPSSIARRSSEEAPHA